MVLHRRFCLIAAVNQFAPSGVVRKRPDDHQTHVNSLFIGQSTRTCSLPPKRNCEPKRNKTWRKTPLKVTEFSISSVHATMGSDEDRHLQHLRELIAQEEWVLLTSLRQSYKLTDYLRRYSRNPLRFVMGVSTFAMLLSEQFYVESAGGMLEATGRLYADAVRVYVQPMSCKELPLAPGFRWSGA